jgi:hypothetical protein
MLVRQFDFARADADLAPQPVNDAPVSCGDQPRSEWTAWIVGNYDDRFWDGWGEEGAQVALDSWWDGDGRSPGAGALWGTYDKTEQKVNVMARDLERAMWAKWIPRLRIVSIIQPSGDLPSSSYFPQVGERVENYAGVKGPIEDRFRELNILKEAGLDGIHWYNSAASEDTKLIDWANRFVAPHGHPIWNE